MKISKIKIEKLKYIIFSMPNIYKDKIKERQWVELCKLLGIREEEL